MESLFKILPAQRIQQTKEQAHSQSNEKRMEAFVSMKAQRKPQVVLLSSLSGLSSGVYNSDGKEEENRNSSYDFMA